MLIFNRYCTVQLKIYDINLKKGIESLRFEEEALKHPNHPKAAYREPSALIVICATASVGYTTDKGVKIIPVGCLRD